MLSRKQLLCVVAFVASLFLVVITCIAPATAQTPVRTPTPIEQTPTPTPTSPDDADISITATVTARELRFDVVPNPTVEFNGRPRRETVWDAERQNLPQPVRPGETYRDIGIRLRITSVFADIDRIVAEALGEVPVSDDENDNNNNDAPPPTPATADEQQSKQLPTTNVPQASLSSTDTPSSRTASPPASRRTKRKGTPR